ncbi:acyl-ACP--UDP-N-acetylglucosamine O-acyltransferase [Neisseriaceae bacterium PsAf]|nr:acyl-ACP--UDP-N-acetylglucosamine O-acyltransferase [Neisseriaceae bacterium PsAf]MCV2503907.1 acyl-ACP--UDP-N-acetylglucosamine O-acyltransferase [Neisseriaceae bacterium]
MSNIHKTAVIDRKAELAPSVEVGAYSVIGPNVKIDEGTVIKPHVVIEGSTTIGKNNRIFQFASIGAIPQDKKYKGEDTQLIIGDNNTIREYCTINIGTVTGIGETRVGNDNWIMAYVHIAHDCVVGNHTILANSTSLAGHVTIKDYVVTGGFTLIFQFCQIGEYAMTAFASRVDKDVPPYIMAAGYKLKPVGLNTEGLRRNGFSEVEVAHIKEVYNIIYRQDLTLEESKGKIKPMIEIYPELSVYQSFFEDSKRSIVR